MPVPFDIRSAGLSAGRRWQRVFFDPGVQASQVLAPQRSERQPPATTNSRDVRRRNQAAVEPATLCVRGIDASARRRRGAGPECIAARGCGRGEAKRSGAPRRTYPRAVGGRFFKEGKFLQGTSDANERVEEVFRARARRVGTSHRARAATGRGLRRHQPSGLGVHWPRDRDLD